MERNTISEMKQILEAIEEGKNIQFTYDGINWNDADRCFKPYAPDFMHNKYRVTPEKKWRPYRNSFEFLKGAGSLGAIWVKAKGTEHLYMVTKIDGSDDKSAVHVDHLWLSYSILFERYTFADGTPCGVEEEDA